MNKYLSFFLALFVSGIFVGCTTGSAAGPGDRGDGDTASESEDSGDTSGDTTEYPDTNLSDSDTGGRDTGSEVDDTETEDEDTGVPSGCNEATATDMANGTTAVSATTDACLMMDLATNAPHLINNGTVTFAVDGECTECADGGLTLNYSQTCGGANGTATLIGQYSPTVAIACPYGDCPLLVELPLFQIALS